MREVKIEEDGKGVPNQNKTTWRLTLKARTRWTSI